MIKSNCGWCGRQVVEGKFCNELCERSHKDMMSRPFCTFYSYAQASKYLGKDTRVIRKYEGVLFSIDKSLPNLHTKLQSCKICGQSFKAHENRAGYCPLCSQAGEGRKARSSEISKLHKGQGNPDYVDGSAKQTFRQCKRGKDWAKAIVERDKACQCCYSTQTLHAHHIIPVALFPLYSLDINNGITLCGYHHIELHRSKLDLQLLPVLHDALLANKLLYEILIARPEFQALLQVPNKPFSPLQLIRVIPKNYRREILRMHPKFANQVLGITNTGYGI